MTTDSPSTRSENGTPLSGARPRWTWLRSLLFPAAGLVLITTVALSATGLLHGLASAEDANHCAAPASATGNAFVDFFTGGGTYMARVHCMTTADGTPDWPWIAALLTLTAGVVLAYLRIFAFWIRSYLAERPADRIHKLRDLAAIFLLCAICGYAMSMVMFAWPAYRLLACLLLLLNVFAWKFCRNLEPFGRVLSGARVERELREALQARADELERRVAEQTAQTNRLAEIARRTGNGVVITDAAGYIEWVNEGFTRMTGYTLDEVRGKKPGSVLQGEGTDRAEVQRIGAALRKGDPVSATLVNYTKSGDRYMVRIDIEPLRDDSGALSGFMSIETDVTELVAASEAIAAREGRLRAILDAEPECVKIVDSKYRLVEMNPAGLALVAAPSADAVVDLDTTRLLAPEYLADYRSSIDRAFAGEQTIAEFEIIALDGTRRWMEQHATGLRDPHDGTIREVLAVTRDTTLRRRMDQEIRTSRDAAEAATRAKSDFLANMSHEIRTPMTAILGYTDLLAEEGDRANAPPERLEYIETIRRNGEHLLAIINDILDLSKIEAGKMAIELIPTCPASVLADIERLMRVKAETRGLSLSFATDDSLAAGILSDPLRLRQILVNLVGNAIKFTEKGDVRVVATRRISADGSPRLHIEVSDTGIGMSTEQIARLFGAFEQADASTTRRFGGTGLGLRISRRLAELLGGDLTVTSVPNRGSTFILDIPAVATPTPHDSSPPVPTGTDAPSLLGARVLLAEDGPDNRRLITFHLTKAGARVTCVENGRLAIQTLTTDGTPSGPLADPPPFDLFITDMQMPVMDGYAATALLRTKGCTLPIIALTANAMSGDRHRCIVAGCDEYVTKPINRPTLLQVCATAIANQRARAGSNCRPAV